MAEQTARQTMDVGTTQPLKLLYFDGSSAAKMSDGTLDSQDLLTWGGA